MAALIVKFAISSTVTSLKKKMPFELFNKKKKHVPNHIIVI